MHTPGPPRALVKHDSRNILLHDEANGHVKGLLWLKAEASITSFKSQDISTVGQEMLQSILVKQKANDSFICNT